MNLYNIQEDEGNEYLRLRFFENLAQAILAAREHRARRAVQARNFARRNPLRKRYEKADTAQSGTSRIPPTPIPAPRHPKYQN